jgi:hypothetical protein
MLIKPMKGWTLKFLIFIFLINIKSVIFLKIILYGASDLILKNRCPIFSLISIHVRVI